MIFNMKRADAAAELSVLVDYLQGRDLKMTRPRQTVLEVFLGIEAHVTAEELYDAVRKVDPRIGQATVFRTVRLLEEAGWELPAALVAARWRVSPARASEWIAACRGSVARALEEEPS